MSAAIEVRGLRKDYRAGLGGREVKALSGIDFAVQPGERRSSENPSPIRRAAAVSAQLGAAVVALVMGDEGPRRMREALTLQPFVTTGLFGAVCLALACLRFRRKDF